MWFCIYPHWSGWYYLGKPNTLTAINRDFWKNPCSAACYRAPFTKRRLSTVDLLVWICFILYVAVKSLHSLYPSVLFTKPQFHTTSLAEDLLHTFQCSELPQRGNNTTSKAFHTGKLGKLQRSWTSGQAYVTECTLDWLSNTTAAPPVTPTENVYLCIKSGNIFSFESLRTREIGAKGKLSPLGDPNRALSLTLIREFGCCGQQFQWWPDVPPSFKRQKTWYSVKASSFNEKHAPDYFVIRVNRFHHACYCLIVA